MTPFEWIAFALVVVLSSARLTRLATYDTLPPVRWIRDKYADATDGSGWQLLAFCGYCASFWLTALVVGTGFWAGVTEGDSGAPAQIWWLINGTLGASYLAATYMAHDGDDPEDDD